MVTAFLRRFFYRYFLEGNHGRVQIINVECIENGKEEKELKSTALGAPRFEYNQLATLLVGRAFQVGSHRIP